MKRKIGNWLLAGVFVLLPFVAGAQPASDDYWTYKDFIAKFPSEQTKSIAFSERVRSRAEPVTTIRETPVKVAVVYPGKQASEYWWRSVSSFEARLKELGLPYEIRPYFSEPGKEVRLQEQQIADALKADPDYLVFTLDAFRHRVMVERILAKGRPKLILQNITTPVRRWGDRQPFLYVGFDHAVGTDILVERFHKEFPQGASYAMLYGPRGYVSTMRGGTFREALLKTGKSPQLASYYVGFNREKARKAAIEVLSRLDHLSFIFACSTDIALGVIDAAKELGKIDQITVNGWGGGGRELQAILSGDLDFTVMRMNDDNGVAMADAIALDQTGRAQMVPTVYSGDMILIEKGMSAQTIEDMRKRAFRYSDYWRTVTSEIVTSEGGPKQ